MRDTDRDLVMISRFGGVSVTKRIRHISQPRGGYLPPKLWTVEQIGPGIEDLDPEEDVPANLVGTAVDYLTRVMTGFPVKDVFRVAIRGTYRVHHPRIGKRILEGITGLDDDSIINAIKMAGFDVAVRAGVKYYKPVEQIKPNQATIHNVRLMVTRSLHFLETYGPVVQSGITFAGGYTQIVSSGDGDYLTNDTIWDYKVSQAPIKKEHTLQLLMYWIMGLHSVHPEYKDVRYLGIYNPRSNTIYRICVDDIPPETIAAVERDVLCYGWDYEEAKRRVEEEAWETQD